MSKLILVLLIVVALVALSEAGRVRRDVICGVRGNRSLSMSGRWHFHFLIDNMYMISITVTQKATYCLL